MGSSVKRNVGADIVLGSRARLDACDVSLSVGWGLVPGFAVAVMHDEVGAES